MASRFRPGNSPARWILLLAVAPIACSSGSERPGTAIVRDSAGIRIVENAAPVLRAEAGWSVGRDPLAEIGANESDSMQVLHRVEGAIRLRDGRIALVNGAAPAIRWYDAKGAFLHGTGRYGQGPGEFDGGEGGISIDRLWPLPGDSVGTWEHSQRRMQVFDPEGRYVRAVVIDLPPEMHRLAYPQISGRIAGGFIAYLLDQRRTDGALGATWRDSATFLLYTSDGRLVKSIARLPALTSYITEMRGRFGGTFRVPASPPFSSSFASWPEGDRFYYGNTERYEVVAYDTSGAVRMLIRRPGPRRPVSPQVIEQFRQSRLAAVGNDPARMREFEQAFRAVTFPDSMPAFRSFRVDREGMLWVREYEPPGAPSVTWSVFDAEGRWVTDVRVPGTWEILDVGGDYILTLETNELDVERVRMYGLRRNPPG